MTTVPVKADDKSGDMTRDELEYVIRTIANEQREQPKFYKVKSSIPLDELLESIAKNIIVPKPGSPSTLELLREDRDR